jgi:hypothetical protein
MPKYDVIAAPVGYAGQIEAWKAAMEEFGKLPKSERHMARFISLYQQELKARGVPFALLRGVDAANIEEAKRLAELALVDSGVSLPHGEADVQFAPHTDEIIIDPPEEGGDETLGYLVLALGLAAAAVPVLWSLFAGRR